MNKRRHDRMRGVLPVRISGNDCLGNAFHELAHTLDITPNGARLGAIRAQLRIRDQVIVQYRQRKIQFCVVWIKVLNGATEYQVGLETVREERDTWGLQPQPVRSAQSLAHSSLLK